MLAQTPPVIPERIRGLSDVANNLAWSWNREARALFRAIDENLWRLYRHNPVDLLRKIDSARLASLAADPSFLERYDAVMQWLAAETSFEHTPGTPMRVMSSDTYSAVTPALRRFTSSMNGGGKDHSRPTRRPIFLSMG